ncbi:MAG: addiction module antidote protein, HigA family [Chthoniobacteraceae bacterium]
MQNDELPLLNDYPEPSPTPPAPPPGDFIRAELEKRGWGQADLAKVIGRPLPTINEIILGKRGIMPEMAVALGAAFGNGAMFWMQKESAYRLSLVNQTDPNTELRAKLFEWAPVKDMEKRGWIKVTHRVEDLEKELERFFGHSLEEEPNISAVARQTFRTGHFTSSQMAWLYRAKQLASLLNVRKFDLDVLKSNLPRIRSLATSPQKTAQVPIVLAELGIRYVVVEQFTGSRIDGAALWLDDDLNSPVIVQSIRFDRIDSFWHTLAHEIRHIVNMDHPSLDTDLVGNFRATPLDAMEERADAEGAAMLIPPDALKSFIARFAPVFTKEKINQFANMIGIHPGIVVGQIQKLTDGWKVHREMLVKIRNLVTTTAITDGWGNTI